MGVCGCLGCEEALHLSVRAPLIQQMFSGKKQKGLAFLRLCEGGQASLLLMRYMGSNGSCRMWKAQSQMETLLVVCFLKKI